MNESRHPCRLRAFAVAAAFISSFPLSWAPVLAQGFPERVIKVVVPWPAGGTADIVARVVTQQLAAKFPRGVIVDNRPGANSIIGTAAVATSVPDGYTLLVASVETSSINPHVYLKLPYDPASTFVPVASIAKSPYAFSGRAGLAATTAKGVVSLINAQPGKLTYGSWGIGSVAHVGMEMILGQVGRDVLHVPFNGGPPSFNALVAGQIDLLVLPAGLAPGWRNEGKIKVFAVTSAERFSRMEDVPTLREEGFNIELAQVLGFMTPRNTPMAVVDLLHSEINAVLKQSDVQAAVKARNAEVFMLSRDEYASYLRSELVRWGEVVRRANIRIDK